MYLIPTNETLITMFVCGDFIKLQFCAKIIEMKINADILHFFKNCGIIENITQAQKLPVPLNA